MNAVLRVLDILRPRPHLIADADTVDEIRLALPIGERVRMMLALSGSWIAPLAPMPPRVLRMPCGREIVMGWY